MCLADLHRFPYAFDEFTIPSAQKKYNNFYNIFYKVVC